MRNAIVAFVLCLCTSLLLNIIGLGSVGAAPANRFIANNYIYYIDNSGSMSLKYHDMNTSKIDVAVKLLHAINEELPDNDANFGVYTYGPHKEYRRVAPFDRDALADAFNQIPTDYSFSGRITPMGSGIKNLDATIAAQPGNVVFVVVTGGDSNSGNPPDEVMQDIYERYRNEVCFHFISFAETSDEKEFVKNLSKLNDRSVSAEAIDLLDGSVRVDFIEKAFVIPPPAVVDIELPTEAATEAKREATREAKRELPTEPWINLSDLSVDILFPFDSARLEVPPEVRKKLDHLIRKIDSSKIQVESILITGHTDRIGDAAYNETLSRERAEAMRNYLREHGVDVPMEIRAMGERDPVTTNCHDDMPKDELIECLQPDRRVSLDLIAGEKGGRP